MNMNFVWTIAVLPDRIRVFCEKHPSWVLAGFSVMYVLLTCAIASKRMLWNDEFFTLYISRLGDVSDILAALGTGADQNPPTFYLFTKGFLNALGETQLAVRLPEMIGVLLMNLCLYRFVAKRSSPIYGMIAMAFPLTTIAYEYAYEARPYGLVLGFSGLALLCWQEATENTRRLPWLWGLAASGAAATCSHYYAVFLLIPLGVGEITRSILRQRIDWPIWIALGGILAPLVLFFPVIQDARRYSHHFWAVPEWHLIPGFYYTLLMPAIGPIVATLIVASLWPAGETPGHMPSPESPSLFPMHEIAAAIGFVSIPVIALIMGKLVIGAFTYRYALSAVIGFSLLLTVVVRKFDNGRHIMATFFILFISGWFMMAGVTQFKHQKMITKGWANTYEYLQSNTDSRLPIVVGDLHSFMSLAYYAPSPLSSRVVYLADPEASLRYLGHDTVDRGILDLKPYFHLSIEEYTSYVSSHDQFLLYNRVRGDRNWLGYFWGSPWDWSWLIYEFNRTSSTIELLGRHDDDLLFRVTPLRSPRVSIRGTLS